MGLEFSLMRLLLHPVDMTRRLAALALVLWLGGLGCLFGCEFSGSASAESSVSSQSALSCSMSAKSHCCHSQPARGAQEQTSAGLPPQSGGEMSGCPLAGQSAVVTSKPRVADVAVLALASERFLTAPRVETQDASFAARQRVPDRGSTYLRCCVFLI